MSRQKDLCFWTRLRIVFSCILSGGVVSMGSSQDTSYHKPRRMHLLPPDRSSGVSLRPSNHPQIPLKNPKFFRACHQDELTLNQLASCLSERTKEDQSVPPGQHVD